MNGKTKLVISGYAKDGQPMDPAGETEQEILEWSNGEITLKDPAIGLARLIAGAYQSQSYGHDFRMDIPSKGVRLEQCAIIKTGMGGVVIEYLRAEDI